jgi:alkaline phosphatase
MIEGSQIDWGGHDNIIDYVTEEAVDFDNVVGRVLDFAMKDKETLVIVTADHETGGIAITDGDMATGKVTASFA